MMIVAPRSAHSAFYLNFDKSSFGGSASEDEAIGRVYQPDFIQEPVSVNGVSYFRTVVGSVESGFVMEAYTTAEVYAWCGTVNNLTPRECVSWSPDGGGMERAVIGDGAPVNEDWQIQPADPLGLHYKNVFTDGNGDPANPWDITGNGTHNPRKVVFRMYIRDGGVEMDVFKPFLDKKPMIRQSLDDTDVRSLFILDARSIGYDDKETPAFMLNSLMMSDPEVYAMNPGAADFDMSKAKHLTFEGGRYTFEPGAGWNTPITGWDTVGSSFDEGVYTYEGAEFDPYREDWGQYFDADFNCAANIPYKEEAWFTAEYGCP